MKARGSIRIHMDSKEMAYFGVPVVSILFQSNPIPYYTYTPLVTTQLLGSKGHEDM